MKEYNKHSKKSSQVFCDTDFVEPSKIKGPSAESAGSFIIGTLTNTHVLTTKSVEEHERFLSICFKEWEEWLQNYYSNRLNAPYIEPYTPTDFREP